MSRASAPLPPLSERFLEFLRPEYPDGVPNDKKFFSTHAVAWNLAVLPPDSPAVRHAYQMLAEFTPENRLVIRATLAELIERKREMFPDDKRLIGDCKIVTHRSGGTSLRIQWAPE